MMRPSYDMGALKDVAFGIGTFVIFCSDELNLREWAWWGLWRMYFRFLIVWKYLYQITFLCLFRIYYYEWMYQFILKNKLKNETFLW